MSYVEDGVLYLDVSIQTDQYVDIGLDSNEKILDFTVEGGAGTRLPDYEGEYVVEPRKVEQILATKNRSMRDDVTVNQIYYAETSNLSGGYTAIIGRE